MDELRVKLYKVYENLFKIKNECSCEISNQCNLGELTVRQIEYLKIIDSREDMTFSRMAEVTNNSKPTISELINRFIDYQCVYKEKSECDGRVSYIHLTEKGKKIARAEQYILSKLVERIIASLEQNEIEYLIQILSKVK